MWSAAPSSMPRAAEPRRLCLLGTCAVDLLEPPLRRWIDCILGVGPAVELLWSPYGDTLTELKKQLAAASDSAGSTMVVALIRLEDLAIVHPESRHAPITKRKAVATNSVDGVADVPIEAAREAELELRDKYGCADLRNPRKQLLAAADDLDRVVASEIESGTSATIFVILLPPPPHVPGTFTADWGIAAVEAEEWLACREWVTSGAAKLLRSADVKSAVQPGHEWYSRRMDRLAHAPFTSAVFQSVARPLARAVHRLVFPSAPKVAVLDCDNTLWAGAVAEAGPRGVQISEHHISLQRFFLDLQSRGTLLALCSRNSRAEDVLDVWKHRAEEMALQLDHIVAHNISMQNKSAGLVQLAQSLCLGIDALVLVDDSPTECAEVASALPQIGVVQLPRDPAQYPHFLKECWIFDPSLTASSSTTATDRARTQLYREVAQRSAAHARFSGGLPAWVASLGIAITFTALDRTSATRAAQLTERTSQMNANKKAIPVEVLLARCLGADAQSDALCVAVRDRFGDHGIVGLLVVAKEARDGKALDVETFLLSCRSLHLGIEHAMLRRLAQLADERGLSSIAVQWCPSERNDAACHFFAGVPEAEFIAQDTLDGGGDAIGAENGDTEHNKICQMNGRIDDHIDKLAHKDIAGSTSEYTENGEKDHTRVDDNMQYWTPELAELSKRHAKRELRRRARDALKQDPNYREQRKRARAARRAKARESQPRFEQVSQHQPFGNKPPSGFIRIPVETARNLTVAVTTGSASAKQSKAEATLPTSSIQEERAVRMTTAGKCVALHHETTLAVGLGLTIHLTELSQFVSADSQTPVHQQLLATDEQDIEMLPSLPETEQLTKTGDVVAHGDETPAGDGAALATFRQYCVLREQARDEVKAMIQKNNPDAYAHVDHSRTERGDA